MNVYIIDDETAPRLILKHLLAQINTPTHIMGEANSLTEGIQDIKNNELTIDVLFLDIEMPRLNGFELLEKLGQVPFDVIFTTPSSTFTVIIFLLFFWLSSVA